MFFSELCIHQPYLKIDLYLWKNLLFLLHYSLALWNEVKLDDLEETKTLQKPCLVRSTDAEITILPISHGPPSIHSDGKAVSSHCGCSRCLQSRDNHVTLVCDSSAAPTGIHGHGFYGNSVSEHFIFQAVVGIKNKRSLYNFASLFRVDWQGRNENCL